MPLNYVVDIDGNRLAVIIPIAEWKELTHTYPDLKLLGTPTDNNPSSNNENSSLSNK